MSKFDWNAGMSPTLISCFEGSTYAICAYAPPYCSFWTVRSLPSGESLSTRLSNTSQISRFGLSVSGETFTREVNV